MWVTIYFDPWDDLTHDDGQGRKKITEQVLSVKEQTTALWHGPGSRLLSYRTGESHETVLEVWKMDGFHPADFRRMEFSQDRPPVYDYYPNWENGRGDGK